MPWPQSSSQSAGFGGTAHVCSRMSQRVTSGKTSHPMLLDGALKLVKVRSGGRVVDVVGPPVGDFGAPAPIVVLAEAIVVAVSFVLVPPPDEHPATPTIATTRMRTFTWSPASRRRRTCAGPLGGSGSPRSPR